jgi:PEP-CTERM motif
MPRTQVVLILCCVTGALLPTASCPASVYVDWITQDDTPVPEPFVVGPDDSLKSILVTESSAITITGGSVVNIDQTLSRSPVRLLNDASAYITGGLLQSKTRPGVTSGTPTLLIQDHGELTITDGTFEALGSLDYVIDLKTYGTVTIWDGTFIGHGTDVIHAFGILGQLTIRGGSFITASEFEYDLRLRSGVADIHAVAATLNGAPIGFGPVSASSGTLSVTYANGATEDLTFIRTGGTLNLIEALAFIEGDLDGDGFVGIADLNIVLDNWNQLVLPGDPLADPSGDGFVGIVDLDIVLGNWNAGTPPGNTSANVPEPASLSLLGVVLACMTFRRR